jgi:hypothetical protein
MGSGFAFFENLYSIMSDNGEWNVGHVVQVVLDFAFVGK